jgi:type I restriction enzyme, S subunit
MKWPLVKLGQIVKIKGGGTPNRLIPEFYEGDIPWATINDLTDVYLERTKKHITYNAIQSNATHLIPAGNIILATRIGIVQVAINTIDVAISQDLKALFCSQVVNPKYLLHYLKLFSNDIEEGFGAITGITLRQLENWTVLLPPLSEQRRIVEIIDQADALRKMRVEADTKGERIFKALFIKMFGDPSNWTSSTNTKPLGSLVNVQSGSTPSKQNAYYWEGHIPWVSPKDIKKDIIFDSIDHISEQAIQETNLNYIEPGAVLIVVRGMIRHTIPIALVGKRLTINQEIKALQLKCNHINSTYLHAAIKAYSRILLSQAGTGAFGTRNIHTDELLKLPIIMPSQEKLQQFSSAIAECRIILSGGNKTKEKIEKLFDTLLKSAFSGDLTAKWRQAHMKELLAEIDELARVIPNYKQLTPPSQ